DLIRGQGAIGAEGDRVRTLITGAFVVRACSKINESECTVEQALSFCLSGSFVGVLTHLFADAA
ncbi:MAG TPA: hypothetical protein VMB73_18650, partial [Acetobacteraceae bacterium]|nr:hypothetical protein [Acetobacteraceae bacterium]